MSFNKRELAILFTIIVGCQNPTENYSPDIVQTLNASVVYDIDIIEPSALFFDAVTQSLLTVSDAKA